MGVVWVGLIVAGAAVVGKPGVGGSGQPVAAGLPDGSAAAGVFAVSYTHLDVYKRQVRGRPRRIGRTRDPVRGRHAHRVRGIPGRRHRRGTRHRPRLTSIQHTHDTTITRDRTQRALQIRDRRRQRHITGVLHHHRPGDALTRLRRRLVRRLRHLSLIHI